MLKHKLLLYLALVLVVLNDPPGKWVPVDLVDEGLPLVKVNITGLIAVERRYFIWIPLKTEHFIVAVRLTATCIIAGVHGRLRVLS